jgi:competence protein ComEC
VDLSTFITSGLSRFSNIPLIKVIMPLLLGYACSLIFIDSKSIEKFFNQIFFTSIIAIGFTTFFLRPNTTGIYIPLIILGWLLSMVHENKVSDPNHYSQFKDVGNSFIAIGVVAEYPVPTSYGIRCQIELEKIKIDHNYYTTSGKVLFHFKEIKNTDTLMLGSTVGLLGKIKTPNPVGFPGEFNWRNHLKSKGIYHESWIESENWIMIKNPSGLNRQLNKLRKQLTQTLSNHIPDSNNLGVAAALLMGNEELLSNDIEHKFAAAGVLHVLCVSGMHLVLLYSIMTTLLDPVVNKVKGSRNVVFPMLLGFIWFYALFTGLSPSITRAASMTTFIIISDWTGRRSNTTNLLAASVIFLFCVEPNILKSIGFQLSFLAVCGIFYVKPILYNFLNPTNRLMKWSFELMTVTLAAQIATTPLSLHLFGQFPNWFLLANIIIVPISTMVMYLGIGLLALTNVPFLSNATSWLSNHSLDMLNSCIDFFSKLPYAVTHGIHFDIFMLITTYFVIMAFIMSFRNGNYNNLILALLSICLMMGTSLVTTMHLTQSKSNFIIGVQSKPVVVFKNKRTAQIICDDSIPENEIQKMVHILNSKHHLKHIQINRTLNSPYIIPKMKLMVIPKWNYRYQSGLNDPRTKNVRTLVIMGRPKQLFTTLMNSFPNLEQLIIKNKDALEQDDIQWFSKKHIKIHVLAESGFFVMDS